MKPAHVRTARFAELDAVSLYRLLRLRAEVFVAEQQSPYNDLDGRDLEPTTWHLWVTDDDCEPIAYLRVLDDQDGQLWIGRVVTAAAARGRGLASQLLEAALELVGDRPVALNSQTHATALYQRYGFTISGSEYLDDGIPHVPMRRPGTSAENSPPPSAG